MVIQPDIADTDVRQERSMLNNHCGKLEHDQPQASPVIEQATRMVLHAIDAEPNREGLRDTPARVARMLHELTAGYRIGLDGLVNGAIFTVDYDEIVVVRDIEFASLCEHHLLPFLGRAHVAYLPNGKVIGLSKIPRIVEMYAQRLQVQERMTVQITDALDRCLNPRGVAVVVRGVHLCSVMRGVRKAAASMVTRAMRGEFKHGTSARMEFLTMLGMHESNLS